MGIFFALFAWGALVPRLYARGWTAQSLIERGLPLSLGALVLAAALVARATAALWTLFCLASTQVSPAQPAVAQALPAAAAGRALSADNLADFAGVFVLKWAIGGTVDLLLRRDATSLRPSRGAFSLVATACVGSYLWLLWFDDHGTLWLADKSGARTVDNPPS
jgi:hypothetical protein